MASRFRVVYKIEGNNTEFINTLSVKENLPEEALKAIKEDSRFKDYQVLTIEKIE